jgi:undecaprenyl-diphosphatase
MMPGTSRSAASIIGGAAVNVTQLQILFLLAVPTMMAVTCYSVFLKTYETLN